MINYFQSLEKVKLVKVFDTKNNKTITYRAGVGVESIHKSILDDLNEKLNNNELQLMRIC